MSESAKKKGVPRKGDGSASKDGDKAMDKKPLPPAKDRTDDSESIERAVYDGMQDLREDKLK